MVHSSFIVLFICVSFVCSYADTKVSVPIAPQASVHAVADALKIATEKKDENPSFDVTLLAHQATYDVKLHSSRMQDEETLQGNMTYEMLSYDNEWIIKQTSHMHVGKTGEKTHATLTSHESNNGMTYGFTAQASSDGDTNESQANPALEKTVITEELSPIIQEIIQCRARITGQGGAGTVMYESPEEMRIDLPAGTVFPLTHLKMLIAKAKKMAPRSVELVNAIVFDGSSDVRAPVRFHAIISRIDPQKKTIALKHPPFTSMPTLYRAEIRVYTMDTTEGKEEEPDYKIIQIFSEDGILFENIVEYGDEKLVSTLTDLKVFTEKTPENTLVMPK